MALWGFADLHAHPASHLGFGAEVNPGGDFEYGIFWGRPGLRWDRENLAGDLPPCDADSHTVVDDGGMFVVEFVRKYCKRLTSLPQISFISRTDVVASGAGRTLAL